MFRSICLLAVGVAAGAAVSLLVLRRPADSGSALDGATSLFETVTGRTLRRGREQRATVSVSERLIAYAAAQSANDITDLQRSLRSAASQPASLSRDLEIDALLARLSELAPAGSAALAQELNLDSQFVVMAYQLWAETNEQAALESLSAITPAAMRRDVALALLEVFGDDAAGAERVSSFLAAPERDAFTLQWLNKRAEAFPLDALREAEAIRDTDLKRRAMTTVAEAWAAQDPIGALRQADSQADASLAQSFRSSVYGAWARLDVTAFADYIESGARYQEEMVSGIQYLLAADPERTIRIAERISGTIGPQIAASALGALAEKDPSSAMARAESLAPGQPRDYAVQSVASIIARTDPDRALAWVQGMSPPVPDAVRTVALSIASSDPARAIEMMDSEALAADSSLIYSLLSSQLSRDPAQAASLASRLAARDDIQSAALLRNLIGNWMQRDAESALDWVLSNDTEVDTATIGAAAQAMANVDPNAAAAYIDKIPPRYRTAWITQVAGPYGRYDPRSAMSWVDQFQGQEAYAVAVRQIVTNAAQTDPRMAAEILSRSSSEIQFAASATVASALAQQDPRAAAAWATTLTDERARSAAVTNALSRWASTDSPAAKRWTLDLRSGESRDEILQNLMVRSASSGQLDRDLLDAFSTSTAREIALRSAIPLIAQSDPDQARELLASPDINDAVRQQIERQIELQRANSEPVIIF